MAITTGLSGNEIYCLAKKNYSPGNIVVGNSVHSIGFVGAIGSSFKAILGGEIENVTTLIAEGRETAYQRMLQEGIQHKASGITGTSSELIFHGSNIEFLSIGSSIHSNTNSSAAPTFSTSDNGQELYAQLDAGFRPICFAFGNVAYSIGIGRGIWGSLKTFARGEIKEFSDIFNHTRHLALDRITQHAILQKANAVLGIQTTILPVTSGLSEMLMIGTASHNPHLGTEVVTSDMTNIEMWNMLKLGYTPQKLLLGTSVFSLGFIGGVTAIFKSFVRGEITELTQLIYSARENALKIINDEAKAIGADDVIGVKTYVYQLQGGLIEFLAIGTAVKKNDILKTESEQLPPQAVITEKDTFYDPSLGYFSVNMNGPAAIKSTRGSSVNYGIISRIMIFAFVILFVVISSTCGGH